VRFPEGTTISAITPRAQTSFGDANLQPQSDWLPEAHSLQTLELGECSVELATEMNAVRSRRQLMSSGRVLFYKQGRYSARLRPCFDSQRAVGAPRFRLNPRRILLK
jgi:hypothetical protein